MSTQISESGSSGPAHVLVVEPAPSVAAHLFRVALSCDRISVSFAESWDQALASLRERRFDVLLVDVDTMRWPALEELATMRAAAPAAHVIALTAEAEPEMASACRVRGADRVLALHDALKGLVTASSRM
jgi:DNA-binding NtrC family response regulator